MSAPICGCRQGSGDVETALLIDGLREEIRRLRAVVDAAKEYRESKRRLSTGMEPINQATVKLDAALAALDKGA